MVMKVSANYELMDHLNYCITYNQERYKALKLIEAHTAAAVLAEREERAGIERELFRYKTALDKCEGGSLVGCACNFESEG